MADILSVGIDIGTSTTQVIFSKLSMENTAGYFTVPHVSIVDKKVIYKGEVHRTPLKNEMLIDAEGIRGLVAEEFRRAGFVPADTDSGAVIITGESARKENADAVLAKLSDFAGEFVVSAAGPDMESVIAGKGSGAFAHSREKHCVVVNLDIGGGTTNVAAFDDGEVVSAGCLDIGGRLVCVSDDLTVTKVSPAAECVARDAGIYLKPGSRAGQAELARLTDRMAELLYRFVAGIPDPLLEKVKTPGSSDFQPVRRVDAVCFSGGVADAVYHPRRDPFAYGDIGVLLGASVRTSGLMRQYPVLEGSETIRATVVGAGTYTTTISGSTITYTSDIFPMKNIPVLKFGRDEQEACFSGHTEVLCDRIRWFMEQTDVSQIVMAMEGVSNPSYEQAKTAAASLAKAADQCLEPRLPVILLIESDIAKAVGQLMYKYFGGKRQVVAIDSIRVEDGDFVDLGRPVMNGLVIPVVVKTLIFG